MYSVEVSRKEYLLRIIQRFFSGVLWDVPPLIGVKMSLLRLLFKIGPDTYVSHRSLFVSPHRFRRDRLEIGRNVAIEHHCELDYSGGLVIGDDVWISEHSIITTHSHVVVSSDLLKRDQPVRFSRLSIGNDSWIGAGAVILGSVRRIGRGAVIGAGTVLRTDVDDYQIVMGNPQQSMGKRCSFHRKA